MSEDAHIRTIQQNKAMHAYFANLAQALNDAGLDMKKVLKPHVEIPWTPTSIKTFMWKPVQDAMLDKESTTELDTSQVDAVYKVLSRHISEKFGINVEFPNSRG
jgi:hypothetical protein